MCCVWGRRTHYAVDKSYIAYRRRIGSRPGGGSARAGQACGHTRRPDSKAGRRGVPGQRKGLGRVVWTGRRDRKQVALLFASQLVYLGALYWALSQQACDGLWPNKLSPERAANSRSLAHEAGDAAVPRETAASSGRPGPLREVGERARVWRLWSADSTSRQQS